MRSSIRKAAREWLISIYAKGAAQHVNPVPNAAVHRGILVTSGVLGKDPKTGEYAQETAEQIRLAFEQLPLILAEAGARSTRCC